MKNVRALFSPGAKISRTIMKSLFAALVTMVVSSTPLIAADLEPGRYAIEAATHAKKFLRGMPEQGNKVVTADNPMATVMQVNAEKDNACSLQSHAFFMSVNGTHNVVMHKANGEREKFIVTKNADGTYSLQAVWDKKYISVKADGNVATSDAIDENAKFKVYKK